MRSRTVLMVSALTATLLGGLWLKPKQPRAEAEAVVTGAVVTRAAARAEEVTAVEITAPVELPAQATQPKMRDGRVYPVVPADTAGTTG